MFPVDPVGPIGNVTEGIGGSVGPIRLGLNAEIGGKNFLSCLLPFCIYTPPIHNNVLNIKNICDTYFIINA
ncbi:hypothetical protein bthur0001_56000 [Bacillus thuringiensis serovar tochigiensis BGSC 4Y1]|nr:hypothetical protein bthur0001_56000 [Bacillus thuringiensis serovar tochigiensis BGSC 4Y1]